MAGKPELPQRQLLAKGEPTALDGLLVIDFTRVVAGPTCTQTLADFGADVIKIENPNGGDNSRGFDQAEIAGESAAYISLNRNKRGIALDLANPAGLEVARDLVAKADVVVENFSGSVMKKFGLDYASLAPTHPRLVYCSISAYGREGHFALRPGFDPITQAESGFMSLNGYPDRLPVRTQPPIIDLATGMSACNAILLALMARERLGRGQQVEVALFDISVAMTTYYSTGYLISGNNPGRFGNSPNGSATVGVFEASDGPLYLASPNDRQIRRLFGEVFERPDLLIDPQFESRKARTGEPRGTARDHGCDLQPRKGRRLDRETEAGQRPRRLSAHGRAGPQRARNPGTQPSEQDPASHCRVGAKHRTADQNDADACCRSCRRAVSGPAHARGSARYAWL